MRRKEIKKRIAMLSMAVIMTQNLSVQAMELAIENDKEKTNIEDVQVVEESKIDEEIKIEEIETEEEIKNDEIKESNEEIIIEEEITVNEEIIIEEEKTEIEDINLENIEKSTLNGWILKDGEYYFYQQDGSLKTGWHHDGYHWYLLNSTTGVMEKGWKYYDNNWYLLDENNGTMKTGWYNDSTNWYMLDYETGVMKTGWHHDGVNWYMLDFETGAMKTGWYNDGSNYYFLNDNGTMKVGLYTDKNGDRYYLKEDTGIMATGWFLDKESNYRYFKSNGIMESGWNLQNGLWYYLDLNTGIMKTGINTIENKKYNFENNGVLIQDRWYDGTTTYSDLNGEYIVINSSNAASSVQYSMVNYVKDLANRESIHRRSIELHGGITNNNCVYFTSELLRRAGVNIPNSIANTRQLESQLLSRGWKKHTNLDNLKPGDIVFAGYAHAYTFLGWAGDGYAYIVDNQKSTFGSVLHKRKVKVYDPEFDTNKSTHFFRA